MASLSNPESSYAINLGSINTNPLTSLNTQSYFNNYFDFPIEVSSNIDAAIIAHFQNITETKEAARTLASAVIYTAIKQGADPMVVLDEFKKIALTELSAYTALFLNLERQGTSLLGFTKSPLQNSYITRTILP